MKRALVSSFVLIALTTTTARADGEVIRAGGSAAGLRLLAEAASPTVALGEPVVVRCRIQNGSRSDAWVLPPQWGSLAIGRLGPSGDVVEWVESGCNPGHASGALLQAGSEWSHDAVIHLTRQGERGRRLFLEELGEHELLLEFRVRGRVGNLEGWLGGATARVTLVVEDPRAADERIVREASEQPELWRTLMGCECSGLACSPAHLDVWQAHVRDVPDSVFAPWVLRAEARALRWEVARRCSRGQGDEPTAREAARLAVTLFRRLAIEHPGFPLADEAVVAISEVHDLIGLPAAERLKDLRGLSPQ